MGEQQRQAEPEPGGQAPARGLRQPGDDKIARALQPGEMRESDDDERQQRDPRLGIEQRCAAALGAQREDDHQRDEDEPDVAREQQQAEIERQQKPGAAPALAHRAPIVQQRQRPERRRHHRGAEIRARHREGGDADHQQHREHGVARADDAAAEREHGPIGDDDAGLRQRVEPERAGDAEGGLAQPEGQRRPEIAAEHEFMADGEQHRHVAGRRAVEQRRHQGPQEGLRQRGGPEHHRRAPAQEFDDQGDVMHWPGRDEFSGDAPGSR